MSSRRFLIPFLASLAIHGVALLLLARLVRIPPPPERKATRVWIDLPSARKQIARVEPKAAPQPSAKGIRKSSGSPPPSRPPASPPSATPSPTGPRIADAPLELDPSRLGARLAPRSTGEEGTETPDGGVAATARMLEQRIQGWRLAGISRRRVQNGAYDEYFRLLGHALRGAVPSPPPDPGPKKTDPNVGQRFIQGWLAAIEDAEAARNRPLTNGERGPPPPQQDVTGRIDQLVRERIGPSAQTADSMFAAANVARRSLASSAPVAVLRIAQGPDGELSRVELVASSGDPAFDAYVRKSAPLALASAPRMPPMGGGIHPDGAITDWAFVRNGSGCEVLLLAVY